MSPEQMSAMLRHAYHQLCEGVVGDGKCFADGLIAPVIRGLEAMQTMAAISDPKNSHLFTVDAALAAFKHIDQPKEQP